MDMNPLKKLGFGLMRLPQTDGKTDIEQSKKMVDKFMEAGFTYFDTAYVYGDGESERLVKTLLTERYKRDRFAVATKLALWHVKEAEDMQRQFDIQRERTGLDFFDVYLLHSMDKGKFEFAERIGAWDFIKGLKEKGLVSHIGFSFHDTADVLDEALTRHPETEIVQLQINYRDWDDPIIQSGRCYEVARRHGKKIVIMEPVKGGVLASLPPEAEGLLKGLSEDNSPASYAIRFAASLDGVFAVLSGMSNEAQTDDNIRHMKDPLPLSKAEREAISSVTDILRRADRIQCTACSYCTKGCPSSIRIPALIGAYNELITYGDGADVREKYRAATESAGCAGDCVKCGQCEEICPQHLKIQKILGKISRCFE